MASGHQHAHNKREVAQYICRIVLLIVHLFPRNDSGLSRVFYVPVTIPPSQTDTCLVFHNTLYGRSALVLRDNTRSMKVQVECYAGRKAEERPVRFRLEGHAYTVEDVLDQWYGPEHVFFKVRADDDGVYILRHQTSVPDGEWELVSFRHAG